MNEVKHFTKAPEIQHFAEVKVGSNDNVYGVTWAEVVKKYLQTAYSGEDANAEVEAFGKIYKVLRRTEVTAFYDKDGNTLFDVTNERLADDYEWLISNPVNETEPQSELGKAIKSIERSAFDDVIARTEDALPEKIENEVESDEQTIISDDVDKEKDSDSETQEISSEDSKDETENDERDEVAVSESSVYVGVVGAVTKLQEELKKAKDKTFADPIIKHLIERCKESESLASDICQDHKTWEKCYKYIYEQARKQARGNSCAVHDDVVYEWAEDYFRKDDKAEEEKKAKEAAERKKKEKERKQKAVEQKKVDRKNPKQAAKKDEKVEEKPVELPKTKRNPKEMDGQMDLFSMMGM